MSRYVSVPLTKYSKMREEIISQLELLGANRVFLCTGRGFFSNSEREKELSVIRDGIKFFKSKNFSVGIWLSSFGHGAALSGNNEICVTDGFTNIVSISGENTEDSFCPLDEKFKESYYSWVSLLAQTDADMIMFDDDFRLSNRHGGPGCFCKNHLKLYEKRLGEKISRKELESRIYHGGENKYRDTYLDISGDTMRSFSKGLRECVDYVNPSMRLGACACMSVWDSDGTDSIEIAKILAGKNKPFMRLIGAAYWASLPSGMGVFANKLGYITEIERMQAHWCENEEIELMSEGDVYPRPRYNVPSAYLEGLDTALLADGRTDGILKYAVDYTSSPTYETGYTVRASRNKKLYGEIEKCFSGKKDVGIHVACEMKKIRDKVFPENTVNFTECEDFSFFQPEQAFLCDNSIPACYGESDVCVCFGENAKYIDVNDYQGMIIDVPAALLLSEKGVDTGLISAEKLSGTTAEYFPCENEVTCLSSAEGLCKTVIDSKAVALSFFDEKLMIPSAYLYTNENGKRFYVLCADMDNTRRNTGYRRSYSRQRQVIDAVKFLSPTALYATCEGNPDLYIMCKENTDTLSVGLWNFFTDSVINPEIRIYGKYNSIKFYNCDGKLDGNTVKLDEDIASYGCAFFELKK